MDRRQFSKSLVAAGLAVGAGHEATSRADGQQAEPGVFHEPARTIARREFDVVVAGGGTAGVVAAIAAARQGARTALVEVKGYPGGTVTEGGTALHSFYNLWKAFPGCEKRQVVRGIPAEIVERLLAVGGTSGHAEMSQGYGYDSVCTAIDTELYKLIAFEMLVEAGVSVFVNTLVAQAATRGSRLQAAIVESRSGREALAAHTFVDCTAYGDLAAFGGAQFTEPNDYPVVNSFGMGNVSMERLHRFLTEHDALTQRADGLRSGEPEQIVRLQGNLARLPAEFAAEARKIGLSMVTTTVHDNYWMFIKINLKMPQSPTDRDAVAQAELQLRQRQYRAVQLIRDFIPGCEKAFMARTSPKLCIRRGRLIKCDYDVTHDDVIGGRHFDDDIMAYGFHDMAPRLQIKDGGTYGVPYRALRVAGLENLLVAGMLITSDHRAHMSTRNTVCCMGQGQAAGTAAALCAQRRCDMRDLPYSTLRDALVDGGVYFESE